MKIEYSHIKLKILFVVLLCVFSYCCLYAQGTANKNVVFISSYSDNHKWASDTRKALENRFVSKQIDVKIKGIYLNSETSTPTQQEQILNLFLSDTIEKPDIIVVLDYEASQLVLNSQNPLLHNVPIVYASSMQPSYNKERQNITGFTIKYGIKETFEIGRKMFPEAKKVYIWSDKTLQGKDFIAKAKQQLQGLDKGVKISYGINAKNDEDLLFDLSNVDKNSFIIINEWLQDDEKHNYMPAYIYSSIAKETNVPILTTCEAFVGKGFIGGYVLSSTYVGNALADRCINIFNGSVPNMLPISAISPMPIFDAKYIDKFNGSKNVLSKEAKVLNSFDDMVEKYFVSMIIAIILIIAVIILVFQEIKNVKLIREVRAKIAYEKKLRLNQKIVAMALPSMNANMWSYDQRENKFEYGEGKSKVTIDIDLNNNFQGLLQYVHPDDRTKFQLLFNKLRFHAEDTFTLTYRGDLVGKGNYMWWECRGILETRKSKAGTYKYLCGIDINIDKQKEIEQHLQEALDKSIQSEKLKTLFLANMSHEIRTPLNAIVGFSDMLANTDIPEEKAEYIKVIKENNELLLRIIKNIIQLSQIESGFININLQDMDVNAFLEELVGVYAKNVNEGVELLCETPYECCVIESDKNFLMQIMDNFIDNAIRFTSSGHITLGYKIVDNGIELFCSDTGTGLTDEEQKKIFNYFEKLEAFRQGVGLGLSLCHSLVKCLNGKIGVQSEKNVGSTFWIFIPCKPNTNIENKEE